MLGNRRRTHLAAIASLILTLILAGAVWAAPVNIDTFDAPAQHVVANSTTPSSSSTADDAANVLGTERDVVVNWVSGSGSATLSVDSAFANVLFFSLEAGTAGNAIITWDGDDNDATVLDPTGLGGVDITDAGPSSDSFLLTVTGSSVASTHLLRVYSSATNFSEAQVNIPGAIATGQSVDILVPLASFVVAGGSGADFTAVGAIQLLINPSNTASVKIELNQLKVITAYDLGDLPAGYGVTLLSENGARHITQGLRMGPNVDVEVDGNPSATANGDDTSAAPDDEDGVVPTPGFNWSVGSPPSNGGSVNVTVAGCTAPPCRLSAWADWNNNFSFADPGDQIFNDVAVTNGTQTLTFPIPVGTVFPNSFYLRFRLCPGVGSCNTVTGEATNGEIEDHLLNFGPTAITLGLAQTSLPARNMAVLMLAAGLLAVASAVVLRRR